MQLDQETCPDTECGGRNEVFFRLLKAPRLTSNLLIMLSSFPTQQIATTYIVELKLWYGEKKHEDAFRQLLKYLEAKNEQKGYLLTFDFRKKKETSSQWVNVGGKDIFDIIV
jgi:hypothetical protein